MAYLIKAERANRLHHYSILLTPDNNHFEQLLTLEQTGLISIHERSTALYPIYIVNRAFMIDNYTKELTELFGESLSMLNPISQRVLYFFYRFEAYSDEKTASAKKVAFAIWYADSGGIQDIREFDTFYRKVRYAFNKLEQTRYIRPLDDRQKGFVLNENFQNETLI